MLVNEDFHYLRGKYDAYNDIMVLFLDRHRFLLTKFNESSFTSAESKFAAYCDVLAAADAVGLLTSYKVEK